MDVTLDASVSNSQIVVADTCAATVDASQPKRTSPTFVMEHEQPRVRFRVRGKRGKVLNSLSLYRGVYRLGSQENIVDLQLKSRGVRPLHAILFVEKDRVMLIPFEHAPVTIPDSDMNMIPVDHDRPLCLHNGQSFDIVGVRFTLEELKPGDPDVNVPPGVVPIEDLPTRYPDPPMSGRSSPGRNRTPKKIVQSSEHSPHRFKTQTSIASVCGTSTEEVEHDEIQPLDSTPQTSSPQVPKKRPRYSASGSSGK